MGSDILVQRLEAILPLDEADEAELRALCGKRIENFAAKRKIPGAGRPPECVFVILEGWAARCAVLPNGSRHITSLLIPGDLTDLHSSFHASMDHGIFAASPCRVACLDPAELEAVGQRSPSIAKALDCLTLIDKAVLRQWIVNSRRPALAAVAHLICELYTRLDQVGLVKHGAFNLPLSQEALAEATGITAVHTNRMIQELRRRNLIELRAQRLSVLDFDKLAAVAGFMPGYLGLGNGHFAVSPPKAYSHDRAMTP